MTITTDPAAVILDRAAAGKTLSTDEIRVLRQVVEEGQAALEMYGLWQRRAEKKRRQVEDLTAERDRLQELAARRSEIFRAFRDRQRQDGDTIRRLGRKVADLEAHLTSAHQTVHALREQT